MSIKEGNLYIVETPLIHKSFEASLSKIMTVTIAYKDMILANFALAGSVNHDS